MNVDTSCSVKSPTENPTFAARAFAVKHERMTHINIIEKVIRIYFILSPIHYLRVNCIQHVKYVKPYCINGCRFAPFCMKFLTGSSNPDIGCYTLVLQTIITSTQLNFTIQAYRCQGCDICDQCLCAPSKSKRDTPRVSLRFLV